VVYESVYESRRTSFIFKAGSVEIITEKVIKMAKELLKAKGLLMREKVLSDGKYNLHLFALLFITYSLVYVTKNCYSAAMAAIVNDGVMTKSQTGLISAMFYLVYAPFQIIGGLAADKYSPHKLIIIGVVGAGIANLLIYYVQGYMAMLIIWTLNAVVQFGVWPSIFKILSSEMAPGYRLSGMFYISLSIPAGLFLSYVCAMLIKSWKYNFLISAITMFLLAAVFYVWYKRIEKKMYFKDKENISIESENSKETENPKENVRLLPLILKAGIPIMLIVVIIQSMLNLGVKSLAPVLLMESYDNITPSVANGLNLILILANPVGVFIAKNRIFDGKNVVAVISLFSAVILPLALMLVFVGKVHILVIIISLALLTIFVSVVSTLIPKISLYFGKYNSSGTMSGLFNGISALGVVLANYGITKVAELWSWGAATKCLFLLTALSLLHSVVTIPIWKRFTSEDDTYGCSDLPNKESFL